MKLVVMAFVCVFLCVSYAPTSWAQAKKARAAEGIAAPLEYQGDYYIHPNGSTIKFLRKQDVFAVEPKVRSTARAKIVASTFMDRFKAQYGNRVVRVQEHRLGSMSVVRVDNSVRFSKTGPKNLKIQPSMLKALDTNILSVQAVLASEKGLGDIIVTSKMLIKLNDVVSVDRDIEQLSKRYRLNVLRRLNTSGALYQVEALNSVLTNTSQRFSFVRRVMNDPLVDWAQPVFKSKPSKASFQPNDPLYDRQWHLSNTGQSGSRCDADCDANNAWGQGVANGLEGAANFSGSGTVIAIVDDGIQLDHEDLRIWTNVGETGAGKETNGIDDDGNGCVDDVNGCDFVDDSVSSLLNPLADLDFCTFALISGGDPVDGSGIKCRCQDSDGTLGPDGDPSPQANSTCLDFNDRVVAEQDNHGTAVAGLAAARGNNGIGVVGTAYSAEILPVRLVSDFDGDINDDFCARAVEAMTYAGRYADVVNNSWTTDIGTCPALDEVISLVVDGALTDNSINASNQLVQTNMVNISKRAGLGSPVLFSAGNDASGWVKVTVPVTAGEHAYEWRFLRTLDVSGDAAIDQSLDDSAWLDDIRFPDGSTEQFESGIPTGDNEFELGCAISECNDDCVGLSFEPGEQCLLWTINSDANFSRSGNSATINHSANLSPCNHSYMAISKNGPAGDISFWIWVSTDLQQFADKVEFLVDGVEALSFGDLARFVDNGVAYPASLDKVIAVGASGSGDLSGQTLTSLMAEERSSYSQYGAALDVLAPANDQHLGIVTTDRYGAGVGFNVNQAVDDEMTPGRYTNEFGGTSASAPIVAGIAAAMIATQPTISAADVEETLQSTAEKIGRQGPGVYVADGNGNTRSDFYGYGRVNMFRALQSVLGQSNASASQNCTPELFSYSVANDLLLPQFVPLASAGMCPALGMPVAAPDNELCVPIVIENDKAALICL